MDNITVAIDESTGTYKFLVNEDSETFITSDSVIRRASHVEPVNVFLRAMFHGVRAIFGEDGKLGDWTRQWDCYWRVNLAPVGGPVGNAAIKPRRYAIKAEIDWLEKNFI